jgi:hypothetical protein
MDGSSAVNVQRKMALYSLRAREIPEDVNEHQIRGELRTALPHLFDSQSSISLHYLISKVL